MLETLERSEDIVILIELKKTDETQNMHRFYRMSLQPDLFGNISLLREWGRIGSRGRIRVDTHQEKAEAIKAMAKLATEKQRRGYRLAHQKTTPLTTPSRFCMAKPATRSEH
jgi:predicted DNA-binding WGR domain protein